MSAMDARERLSGWLVNGASTLSGAVLLDLYIEKSDGNTWLETMLCIGMGALGIFLIRTTAVSLLRYPWKKKIIKWRHLTKAGLSFLVGPALLITSLNIIDREDTDYLQPSAIGEGRVDANGFKLVDLEVNHGAQDTRISINVVNDSKAPLVLNYIKFLVSKVNGPACWSGADVYTYSLGANIRMTENAITEAYVVPSEGVQKGRDVPVSGTLFTDACKHVARLEGSFDTSVPVQPQHIVGLAIDIPNTFTVDETRRSGEEVEASFQLANKERKPFSFVALVAGFDGDANGACVFKRDPRRSRESKGDPRTCESLLEPLKRRVK